MSKIKGKGVVDGATLSVELKPKPGEEDLVPLGKTPPVVDGKAVAKHYKHAASKSNTYSSPVVDMIYYMARSGHLPDNELCQFLAAKFEAERNLPAPHLPPTWDQLVFLSANLTRLVIDPYREKCNSRVEIGGQRPRPLTLDWPVVVGGIDFARIPSRTCDWAAQAVARANLAVFMHSNCQANEIRASQRIVQVDVTAPTPDLDGAAAVAIHAPTAEQLDSNTVGPMLEQIRKQTRGQIPVGVTAPAYNAVSVVDETIQLDVDFYVADGQWTDNTRPTSVLPELSAAPAIHVLADTVERLRHHCREETVKIIYQGGIRAGADAGKAISVGATAVGLGLSAIVSMGFKITRVVDEATILEQLEQPQDGDQAIEHLVNFAKSVNMEVTMLARACGKSCVTNMEPEDLRALTIAVSAATGIPVVGKDYNFRHGV